MDCEDLTEDFDMHDEHVYKVTIFTTDPYQQSKRSNMCGIVWRIL